MNTQHSELSSLILELVAHDAHASAEGAPQPRDPILQGAAQRLFTVALAGLLVWMPLMSRLTTATDTVISSVPSIELPRPSGKRDSRGGLT